MREEQGSTNAMRNEHDASRREAPRSEHTGTRVNLVPASFAGAACQKWRHVEGESTHPALAVVLRTTSPKQAPLPDSNCTAERSEALSARNGCQRNKPAWLRSTGNRRARGAELVTCLVWRGGQRTLPQTGSNASETPVQPCGESNPLSTQSQAAGLCFTGHGR